MAITAVRRRSVSQYIHRESKSATKLVHAIFKNYFFTR